MLTRRFFLRRSALAMVGVGSAPLWLRHAVAAETTGGRRKVLVAVFQRGAADGLNIVVPFGDPEYYRLRPTIAVPPPSKAAEGGTVALDLDGFFGLHPALAPLRPVWEARSLAVVHAAGSPDPTRSHFDAQDYMESGTPGVKSTHDGWLNRALPPQAAKRSPLRALAVGQTLPRTLRGGNAAVAVNNLRDFQVRGPVAAGPFQSMYENAFDSLLRTAGKETFDAVALLRSIEQQGYVPAGGADYPRGRLGDSLKQIAQLIKADVGVEVAFTDVGGWDHHVNEVGRQASEGQLANALSDFARSLAAFWRDLDDRMADVTVVTMSEFGRTARENGDRGTDHGHGNVMFVMGGGVRGGKVHGQWPGLAREQLYEARDLNVTTDFRDVLGELVSRWLGNKEVKTVFPGYAGRWVGLLG